MLDVDISKEFDSDIKELVRLQKEENKEAIFFIYDDLSTSDIYTGESTSINLTRAEEQYVMSQGEIIGSVHTHPTGYDPSTIDIMTGLATTQKYMCVATPLYNEGVKDDYVLTVMDLSSMPFQQRFRMMRAMRRSSLGVTEIGRRLRKEFNLQRFDVKGYRSHEIEVDGIRIPVYQRPSLFDVEIGEETAVRETDGMYQYIE